MSAGSLRWDAQILGLMNIFLLAFEWNSLGKEKWYESLAGSWVMDLVWYSAEMARVSAVMRKFVVSVLIE